LGDNTDMRLGKLKALSVKEWQVLLISMVLLPSIALALRFRGYKWTRAFLQKHIPERDGPGPDVETSNPENSLLTAQSVARMVSIAANNGPYRANCLKKSLATWWLLARREIATELNIGVNKDGGDFSAHAWVEYRGNTLVEADDVTDRYSKFGQR